MQKSIEFDSELFSHRTYVKFFVTFATKHVVVATGRRGLPFSKGHGLRNRLVEEHVHPNCKGDNVTQGVYFKSQRRVMEGEKKEGEG